MFPPTLDNGQNKIRYLPAPRAAKQKKPVSSQTVGVAKQALQQKDNSSLTLTPLQASPPAPLASFFETLLSAETTPPSFALKQTKRKLNFKTTREPEEIGMNEITKYIKPNNTSCQPTITRKNKVKKHEKQSRVSVLPSRSVGASIMQKRKKCVESNSIKTFKPLQFEDIADIKKINPHPKLIIKAILDAENLINDFYFNILSVSKNNTMACALADDVYLKGINDSEIFKLTRPIPPLSDFSTKFHSFSGLFPTSLFWLDNRRGELLAIGTSGGYFEIWDTSTPCVKMLFQTKFGSKRITSIAQLSHDTIAVGSREMIAMIRLKDSPDGLFEGISDYIIKNESEICQLVSSPDGQYLASGENDNLVKIWKNSDGIELLHTFQSHNSAIKAISWNPCFTEEGLLATGGGTADMTIKLWDVHAGKEIFSVYTNEQVTGLHWLSNGKYLISTHGFPTSSVRLWYFSKKEGQYKLDEISVELGDQSSRILYTSLSTDNNFFVTGGGENIKIWQIKGQDNDKVAEKIRSLAPSIR